MPERCSCGEITSDFKVLRTNTGVEVSQFENSFCWCLCSHISRAVVVVVGRCCDVNLEDLFLLDTFTVHPRDRYTRVCVRLQGKIIHAKCRKIRLSFRTAPTLITGSNPHQLKILPIAAVSVCSVNSIMILVRLLSERKREENIADIEVPSVVVRHFGFFSVVFLRFEIREEKILLSSQYSCRSLLLFVSSRRTFFPSLKMYSILKTKIFPKPNSRNTDSLRSPKDV